MQSIRSVRLLADVFVKVGYNPVEQLGHGPRFRDGFVHPGTESSAQGVDLAISEYEDFE